MTNKPEDTQSHDITCLSQEAYDEILKRIAKDLIENNKRLDPTILDAVASFMERVLTQSLLHPEYTSPRKLTELCVKSYLQLLYDPTEHLPKHRFTDPKDCPVCSYQPEYSRDIKTRSVVWTNRSEAPPIGTKCTCGKQALLEKASRDPNT